MVETPKKENTDLEYMSAVSRFANGMKKPSEGSVGQTKEEAENAFRWQGAGDELRKLGRPEQAAKEMQNNLPMAVQALGMFTRFAGATPEHMTEEGIKTNREGNRLFKEAAKKIFPDKGAGSKRLDATASRMFVALEKFKDFIGADALEGVKSLRGMELRLQGGRDEQELSRIDAAISALADSSDAASWEHAFGTLPDGLADPMREAIGAVYELQLMRDAVESIIDTKRIGKTVEETKTRSETRAAAGRENDMRGAEAVREKLMLEEIKQMGGASIHTSLPRNYHPNGSAGFIDVPESRLKGRSKPRELEMAVGSVLTGMERGGVSEILNKQDIDEVVVLIPATKDIYENVEVPSQQKFLGVFAKAAKTERRKTGTEAVKHGDLVTGGTDEPAYTLIYEYQHRNPKSDALYKDYTGRGGQMLKVEITLPKSVAERTFAQIQKNPAFARQIAAEAVLKMGIPEKTWSEGDEYSHFPLRPPYEKAADEKGGTSNMLVIGPDAERQGGIKPEYLKRISGKI